MHMAVAKIPFEAQGLPASLIFVAFAFSSIVLMHVMCVHGWTVIGPTPHPSVLTSFMDGPYSAQKASQFGLGSCSALLRETGSYLRFINRGLVHSPLTPFIRSSRLAARYSQLRIIPLPYSLSPALLSFHALFIARSTS